MVLVLVAFGRWLEASAKLRASRSCQSLRELLPRQARRIDSETETSIDLESIQIDDLLRVLPGERVPCDGRLQSKTALLNEQIITGENDPVAKSADDLVTGGSLSVETDLTMRVTATPEQCAVARIVEQIQKANASKGRLQLAADRIASCYRAAWCTPTSRLTPARVMYCEA